MHILDHPHPGAAGANPQVQSVFVTQHYVALSDRFCAPAGRVGEVWHIGVEIGSEFGVD